MPHTLVSETYKHFSELAGSAASPFLPSTNSNSPSQHVTVKFSVFIPPLCVCAHVTYTHQLPRRQLSTFEQRLAKLLTPALSAKPAEECMSEELKIMLESIGLGAHIAAFEKESIVSVNDAKFVFRAGIPLPDDFKHFINAGKLGRLLAALGTLPPAVASVSASIAVSDDDAPSSFTL